MADNAKKFIPSMELQERCDSWVKSQSEIAKSPDKNFKKDRDSEQEECFDTDSEFDSVSECGVKRRRLAVQVKKEVLNLSCGWKDCNFVSSSMDRFVEHVSEHIPNLEIHVNDDQSEFYICSWKDCSYESEDSSDIACHVNYHSYHTKLLCIGSNVRTRVKLPRCHRAMEMVWNVSPPHICQWEECLRTLTNYQLFLYHVKQHMECKPRGNKVIGGIACQWTGCRKKFPSLYTLRNHLRHHTKEKIVACPDCGATFATNTKFHEHCRRQIPLAVQGFQCSYCNKFYPTEGILREHMRFHIFYYKCSLCDMSCKSKADLVKHIRYRHVQERPFPCQLCTHAAKSQQDLDSHMTVHTSGPNFICNYEGCSYTCKNAYVFDRHIERAHTDEVRWYCCRECPIKYRKSYTLSKHLIEEHNLQPAGHKRFQYIRDDDGYYRAQMIRYEGIDDDENSSLKDSEVTTKNYKVKADDASPVPAFEIVEDNGENEDCTKLGTGNEQFYTGETLMPTVSNILISIDEMDADGNIIESKIIQAQETSELPPSKEPPIILT